MAPDPTLDPGSPTLRAEDLAGLGRLWADTKGGSALGWDCLFVLPPWLEAWWEAFGTGHTPWLRSAWAGGAPAGVAPLMLDGDTARFLGSPDVCDVQDLVVAPATAPAFCTALLLDLRRHGVARLDLGSLRPEAATLAHLVPAARALGCPVTCEPDGASLEVDLPGTWEGYLARLDKKQRHEVRRKLRRLGEAGPAHLRRLPPGAPTVAEVDRFLGLFRASRADKESFLTPARERFFRLLTERAGRANLLNLAFLELGGETAAAVLCFDHGGTTHLYNNGYDPRFEPWSAGLAAKLLSLRDAIERGATRYDLLKGTEEYKRRLGGRPVPLVRCRIDLR
ncbi:MAG: GNAT family N-acetyltransferase [Deferrisomatales bacterium]